WLTVPCRGGGCLCGWSEIVCAGRQPLAPCIASEKLFSSLSHKKGQSRYARRHYHSFLPWSVSGIGRLGDSRALVFFPPRLVRVSHILMVSHGSYPNVI